MRLKSHLDTLAKLSVTVMCITSGLALQWSCSTANEAGRCTSYEAPKYVAAMSDTDGKPWEIIVAPKVADFTCDNRGDKGTLRFSAVVLDGQKQAKPAVAIQAVFSGLGDESKRDTSPGIYSNPANGDDTKKELQDDVATDACGVATFVFEYNCPESLKSVGGSIFMQSGPLFSEPVKVTVENKVQLTPTPVPNP